MHKIGINECILIKIGKWIKGGEEKRFFFITWCKLLKEETLLESRKSPFHKHLSNNWLSPESLIDTEMSGWKFNGKQGIMWSQSISPQNIYYFQREPYTVYSREAWQMSHSLCSQSYIEEMIEQTLSHVHWERCISSLPWTLLWKSQEYIKIRNFCLKENDLKLTDDKYKQHYRKTRHLSLEQHVKYCRSIATYGLI